MTVKVLHVLGPLRPSGMERMLVSASKHFAEQGIESSILGQGDDHPYKGQLRSAGYNVQTMSPIIGSWRDFMNFRSFVREMEFDVVHIHTEGRYLLNVLACASALGGGGAIVRTVHNVFAATGRWRLQRLVQSIVADRLVKVLIAPSADVAAQERANFRRMRVIYNWVDDGFLVLEGERTARKQTPSSPAVALIVGNCSSIKHHELALQAVLDSGFSLIHLGEERDASARELAILNELDKGGRLLMRGVHQPNDALLAAECFLMSSRHEGMGVALAEALIAGVPAVVTDVPGLQWCKDIQGVLSLPDNQFVWTEALKSRAYAMQTISSESLPDFSASRGAQQYAKVYREVSGVGGLVN